MDTIGQTTQIDGITYTLVRIDPCPYTRAPRFIINDPQGRGHTLRPWAKRPDLYSLETANGCSGKETVQMVNGKLVDRTSEFRAAKVTSWTSMGKLHYRYDLNGVDLLAA